MALQDMVEEAQKTFPTLQIKFKDSSWLMKLLGALLFFAPKFMTSYVTTIGYNVYFPNQAFIDANPVDAEILLAHELMHCNDAKNMNPIIFGLLYMAPIVLVLPALLFFLISWKLALPLVILFASPVPAYFRYLFEKRAYMVSIYANSAICKKIGWNPNFANQEAFIISQFTTGAYYWMWPFNSSLTSDFDAAVKAVQVGQRPFSDPFFDILDTIIAKA